MKKTFLFILLFSIFLPSGFSASLLIIADEQANMKILQKYLEGKQYVVQIVDQPQLPKDLSTYSSVFLYVHSTMTDETSKALIYYTKQGGRLVLLHHAIASSRLKNLDFLDFVGIHLDSRDHPTTPWLVLTGTHTVVNLNPTHYITSNNVQYPKMEKYQGNDSLRIEREYPAFDLPETEIFLNQQFTDGTEKTVLFGFKTTNSQTGKVIEQDRSGWLKKSGKGWIIYIQPGHSPVDFQNPLYLQIIQNTITWNPKE